MQNAGMDNYCRGLIEARLISPKRDLRYTMKAYEFVFKVFSVLEKVEARQEEDFSAKQITDTAVSMATGSFGPLAKYVLSDMGIKRADDFYEIISNFVDLKIFTKTEYSGRLEFEELAKKPLFAKTKSIPLDIEKLKNFDDS